MSKILTYESKRYVLDDCPSHPLSYIPAGKYLVTVENIKLFPLEVVAVENFELFYLDDIHFSVTLRVVAGKYSGCTIMLESYAFKGEYEEHMKNFLRSFEPDYWIDYDNIKECMDLLDCVYTNVKDFVYEFDYKPCMCQNNFQLVNLVYKGHVDHEER